VLLPVVEDLLCRHRTDAGQRIELVGGGRVEVHGPTPDARTGSSVRPGNAGTAPRNHDLFSVCDRRGEVHQVDRGGTRGAAGTHERVGDPSPVGQSIETWTADSPDDVDVHRGRPRSRRGGGDRNPWRRLRVRARQQLPRKNGYEQQRERTDDDLPPRELKVRHTPIVAAEVARVGDDFAAKRRHTVAVFALLSAAVIAASGLHGTVVIDPARPVCIAEQSCSAPDRYDVLAFWRAGHRIAQTKTDASGRYRVSLPPGTYAVRAPRHAAGPGRGLLPSRAVVPRGRYARANFTLDIGIR